MSNQTATRHAWIDGTLTTISRARIAPDDRGVLLGDGVFETLLAQGGAIAFGHDHIDRLRAGASALGIPFEITTDQMLVAAKAVLTADGLDVTGRSAAVRITLTRGPGPRGLLPPDPPTPTLLITAAPLDAPATAPAALVIADERRLTGSVTARFKTLSALGAVLARRQAAGAGADEALVLNEHGRVAGASAANVFAMIGSELITPPLDEGALPGVTRKAVIAAATALGQPVVERPLSPDDLVDRAQLAFLTSSLIGLRQVASIDGRLIGDDGRVHPGEPSELSTDRFASLRRHYERLRTESMSGGS